MIHRLSGVGASPLQVCSPPSLPFFSRGERRYRSDEDVIKRMHARCLGSHTSKTVRRAVKGPRGVRPSDRGANWYVRLRSPACPLPSARPSSRPRSLGLGRMIGCQTRDRSLNSSSSARFRAARFLPHRYDCGTRTFK